MNFISKVEYEYGIIFMSSSEFVRTIRGALDGRYRTERYFGYTKGALVNNRL